MFSEFLSFCCFFFMGVSSNLEVFLSEKHLNDHMEDREFITTILTTSPAMEQTNNDQEDDHQCHASTKQDLMHELIIKTTKQQPVQEQRYHDEQGKEDHHHQVITQQQQQSKEEEDDDDDKNATVPPAVVVLPPSAVAPLGLKKLKIPPYKEEETEKKEGSNEDDGLKTPTSPEHRIPAMLRCPPAPRKPKTTTPWPCSATKRKAGCSCRARVVLDFSEDIESLFPTPFAADLGGDTGGNNKKVKLKLFAEPQ